MSVEPVEVPAEPEPLPVTAGACCCTIVRSAGGVVAAVCGSWLSGRLSPLEPLAAVTGSAELVPSLFSEPDVVLEVLCLASWSVDDDALVVRPWSVAPDSAPAPAEDVPEMPPGASAPATREPVTPLVVTGPFPPEAGDVGPAFPAVGASAPLDPEFPVPVESASWSAAAFGLGPSAAASALGTAITATSAVPEAGEPAGNDDVGSPPFSASPLPEAASSTELPETEAPPLTPGASPSGSEPFCAVASENCPKAAVLDAAAISGSTGRACADPSPWSEEPPPRASWLALLGADAVLVFLWSAAPWVLVWLLFCLPVCLLPWAETTCAEDAREVICLREEEDVCPEVSESLALSDVCSRTL